MQAVALISFQEPGLELHHPGFIIRAALAGEDLEAIPAGVSLGELGRGQSVQIIRVPAMDQIFPQTQHKGAVARAHQLLRGVGGGAMVERTAAGIEREG